MRCSNLFVKQIEDKFIGSLRNCTSISLLQRIHAQIVVSSLSDSNFLATQMIHVCNSNRKIDYASLIFKRVNDPNIFLYNAMIRAQAQNHRYLDAIELYKRLRSITCKLMFPDRFTYPFVLKSSTGLLMLDLGREIHVQVVKSGLELAGVVQNSLIEMYTKCEDLASAHNVFDQMHDRDVVSWNTIMSSHARLGQMRKAKSLFVLMPVRSVVSWTALISGYASIGCFSESIDMFHQMQLSGIKPDEISIVSVLPACAQLGALAFGKWIHVYAEKQKFLQKTYICNALIELYSKCGSIDEAKHVFDKMPDRDVISWSTMISALAAHGRARDAVDLFSDMEKDGKVKPNLITFLGVLSACAHGGLLEDGVKHFDSMSRVYGLSPEIEHYGCMIDLHGRSGQIDRALAMINRMVVPPDAAIWGSLLSACRMHGDIETAEKAMEKLMELEPRDTGNYVMLSNIYAAAGKWDGVARMRKLIRSKSMAKTPGCSLLEVNNAVREFIAGDDSLSEYVKIVEMLDLLGSELELDATVNQMDAASDEIFLLKFLH